MPPLNLRQQEIAGLDTETACWRLYVDGLTMREIAARLGIGTGTVSRAIRRSEKRAIGDVDQLRRVALAQLQRGRALAMEAYHGSISERTRRRSKRRTTPGEGDGKATVAEETEIVTEARLGDPRYLSEARRCTEAAARLCGLNAPIKLQAVESDRPYVDLTNAEVERELAEALAALAAEIKPLPPAP